MELYWLLRLPHLHNILDVFGITLFVAFIILIVAAYIALCNDEEDAASTLRKLSVKSLVLSFIIEICACMCPDKTDLALMLGWDAINCDSVQEVIEILKERIK